MNKFKDKFTFRADGRPIPYSRPRFRSKKNPKGTGTDQANAKLEELTWLVKGMVATRRGWDKSLPLKVIVTFGFSPPKKEGGRGKDHGYIDITCEQLDPQDSYYAKQPDTDNLLKMVCEALQHGGAVKNDSQCVIVVASKLEDIR